MDPKHIAVVGLGYVGLPLAHALANAGHKVTGYDVNESRIQSLDAGQDNTNELTEEQLKAVEIHYTNDPAHLKESEVIILALPTPVDGNNEPDLTILKAATETVGQQLSPGMTVVYESTVYPGTTEEICGPILEEASGLKSGKDFFLGYSPERINPGDKERTIDKIIKVVAGQNDEVTDMLCELYGSIVTAGVHRAPNIKVAEMAKAIENAQRDLNIAFVNEVAKLSNAIGISSGDVLAAAGTKWNFLPFKPGLVGGHCIGVDPYYLVAKAKELNVDTQVITAGRSVNDGMGAFVAKQIHNALGSSGKRILVLGVTFKENVPDQRNSKVGDVIGELVKLGHDVEIHDPYVPETTTGSLNDGPYDAVALLVTHQEYLDAGEQALVAATKEGGVVYDLKGVLSKATVELSSRMYVSL